MEKSPVRSDAYFPECKLAVIAFVILISKGHNSVQLTVTIKLYETL